MQQFNHEIYQTQGSIDDLSKNGVVPPTPVTADSKNNEPEKDFRQPIWILAAALVMGILLDLLFFDHEFGAQWAIGVNAILIVSVLTVWFEKRSVPKSSWALIVLTGLSAFLTLFRREGFTLESLIMFGVVGLLLTAITLLNGQWAQYRIREHFKQLLLLIPSLFIGFPKLFGQAKRQNPTANDEGMQRKGTGLALLRGLLIALPLLLIFGGLLASADAIFSEQLRALFDWIRWENPEKLWKQLFLIVFFTWGLAGALWHVHTQSSKQQEIEPDQALIKPFLGITEASVVLGSLIALFAAFLIVQFRYFFAGEANISLEGFTYAEYARRGFFELVAVGLFAGLLHYVLSAVTHRENKSQRLSFSIMATLLLAEVGVMLVSAFQRLSLYEQAYGFTQERLVAHTFTIFLGVLLALLVWMEISRRHKHQAVVLILAFFLFALSLAVINVDRTVARLNLERALAGEELDSFFLVSRVREDAIPLLFDYYDNADTPEAMRAEIGQILACRAKRFTEEAKNDPCWVARNFSKNKAARLFGQHQDLLESYTFDYNEVGFGSRFDGEWYFCTFDSQLD